MIFVVLGTQKFQLNRLLIEIDRLIEEGKITEEVVAQIGNSTYKPKNFKSFEFLDKESFDLMVAKADKLVTHSGVGTIITALSANKPVIVFPRLCKYKEHVDDHQLDIAKAFEKKKYVLCCYEGDLLEDKLNEMQHFEFDKYISEREKMVNIIDSFIEDL